MHTVDAAAAHFVPPRRDAVRHEQLVTALRRLWGSDRAAMCRCHKCGFGFADPFVAGTAEIYNLMSAGDPHYPRDRFEFAQTIDVLRAGRPARLLEIGAGDGAFIRKARDAQVVTAAVTTEYDEGAVAHLRATTGNVNTVFQGSLEDLAMTNPTPFDAICLFQVLEHMDRLDEAFATLGRLCVADGAVFVSVPNPARIEMQERLTSFWDMPPNHIGQWTRRAVEAVAGRAGFTIVGHRFDDDSPLTAGWQLAKYRWEARAYNPSSLGAKINGIPHRHIRGVLKRTIAAYDLAILSRRLRGIPPQTQWFHLARDSTATGSGTQHSGPT
jgi:2-polyprenyl-3-methyl-5-hydroxy-6-metoxy-1,4-benzoquinol methylase